MSYYPKDKLGKYIDILSGFAFKSKDFSDKGIPVIKIKNINPPCVTLNDLTYIPYSIACQNSKYILKKGDILIAMTGSHINQIASVVGRVGRVLYDDITVLNQRVGKIININKDNINIDYVYYFLSQYSVKVELAQKAGGAANQANISPSDIKNLWFPYPPINIQNRIAKILSRYDALIENYHKQIKLLEESAQRLYKEWFVDLRFPGYENTKIVDGVPEGWEKKKAKEFFYISIGKTPPRVEKKWFIDDKDSIPWVSISDMKNITFVSCTNEKLTREACDKFNVKIIPVGTIILSFKLTVGRVAITSIPMCTNEAIAHFFREGNNWRAYTYNYLKNYNYDSLGNTSGISKALNSTIVKNMPFIMPSKNILDSFNGYVSSYFVRVKNLSTQVQLLAEARDRLLPKLMSGEIEV